MKLENLVHRAERLKRATQPVYIVQFWHVPTYGRGEAYPFSRAFSSGFVNEPTEPILECIESITGGPAQIVPEQGRASIGGFRFDCVDLDGEVLRYFSFPQLALLDAISAGVPGVGDELRLDDVSGLPAFGTIEVGVVGDPTLERIRYSAKDLAANSVTVSGRGVDDTTAQGFAVGTFVTNGEQIRSGQRCRLLSGYQTMVMSALMESQRVEVVDRNTIDIIRASFTIDTADITRAMRREVFLTATMDAPFLLGGHPLDIALQVLLSTGVFGGNGPYDTLAEENGLGIPHEFIDVVGIEQARDEFPSDGYCFTITGPEMAKGWLEDQIFKTINAYPVVLEDGRLTVRLYTPVLT